MVWYAIKNQTKTKKPAQMPSQTEQDRKWKVIKTLTFFIIKANRIFNLIVVSSIPFFDTWKLKSNENNCKKSEIFNDFYSMCACS